jgi:hypothetical protein
MRVSGVDGDQVLQHIPRKDPRRVGRDRSRCGGIRPIQPRRGDAGGPERDECRGREPDPPQAGTFDASSLTTIPSSSLHSQSPAMKSTKLTRPRLTHCLKFDIWN